MTSTITTRRKGGTLTEVLVAIGVLSTLMTVTLPMSIKLMRFRQVYRQRLLVVEELSNEMDRLTWQSPEQVHAEAGPLELPDELAQHLVDATLTLSLFDEESATRLQLSCSWQDRMGNTVPPVTLTGWVYPQEDDA